jgi:hypothetical protein
LIRNFAFPLSRAPTSHDFQERTDHSACAIIDGSALAEHGAAEA